MKFVIILALVFVSCHGRRLTIDELIASATKVNNLDYLTDLNGRLFMRELDMVLTKEQYDALQATDSSRKKRKAVRETDFRWTEKTIPYKMAPGVFGSKDLEEINKAMNEWSTYTCVNFIEATSHENYVYFDDASGCYSYVGMTGGSQTIGLAGGCRYKGVIAHEIGHAVGFHHEQNRPDRDNYVQIIRENIPSNLYYNFKKYPESAVNNYNVPYDYGSIMHYGGRAFSINGQLTIKTLNSASQDLIGNREGLSFHDIKLANLMYSCSERCDSSIRCPSHGFLGKDCNCYCPGNPVQSCDAETGTEGVTKAPTERPPVTAPPCENLNEYCEDWVEADRNYCNTHQYLQLYCKKACNLCEVVPTLPPCVDEKEHCEYWMGQGFCTGEYETFMRSHCKKSCNYCDSSSSDKEKGSVGSRDGNNGSVAVSGGVWALLSAFIVVCINFRASAL